MTYNSISHCPGVEPSSAICYSTILTTVPLITQGQFATLKSGIYGTVTGKPTDKKRHGVMTTACLEKCVENVEF